MIASSLGIVSLLGLIGISAAHPPTNSITALAMLILVAWIVVGVANALAARRLVLSRDRFRSPALRVTCSAIAFIGGFVTLVTMMVAPFGIVALLLLGQPNASRLEQGVVLVIFWPTVLVSAAAGGRLMGAPWPAYLTPARWARLLQLLRRPRL